MPDFNKGYRAIAVSVALVAMGGLGACSNGPGLTGLTSMRTQGYEISQSALQQIRPGQSEELVKVVMGSPQTKGTFGDESAYYYVQTKIQETNFGLKTINDRTVLAVYFDSHHKVKDKAIYTLKDGKLFAIETRRTASFGQDRTFVEQILNSVGVKS